MMAMHDRRRLIAVVAGTAVSILFGAISFFATAGGHGTYVPAAVLFPAAMLLAIQLGVVANSVLSLAAVQWPLYGLTFAVAVGAGRGKVAMIWLAVLHSLLVIACFLLDGGQFL